MSRTERRLKRKAKLKKWLKLRFKIANHDLIEEVKKLKMEITALRFKIKSKKLNLVRANNRLKLKKKWAGVR